ncbi:Ankyrin repeat domain-containing protein 50 [Lasiodiplodia theobromae]|uniref:Ankyrin repeat domain-containing protein 50 n=1 Tax=Lasiodiplodia theobromae TaxID=45133 RepID=A0A5N5CTH0_9PEZI|nr:Ankyrin repeat domain-containing protein 50 [Lasiodiplodia theobromae]
MLLEHVIQSLGESPVVCFIDALDECEEAQIRDMISFFELVGELTSSSGINFQVCFSSRHYPHITIRKGLDLVLEGQEGHTQDIANYLETELKIGKSKVAQQIRGEIQEKASGVFMWVVLVVEILNKEHDRGRMHALRRRLQEIPSELHELFREILTRDSHNRDELVLCIQWVLFARQPLSPEQLYFAILSGVEADAISRWDPDEISIDVIKRFILDSSKGLTEITKSKLQKVQFIHESDNNGQTALSSAAEKGHEAVVRLLLETDKVDVNSKDNNGQTALSSAAQKGHEAVARLLLETGKADLNSKDNSGRTALSWAGAREHEALARLLLETGKVNFDSETLSWAAKNGHRTIVKLLLEKDKGTNFNAQRAYWGNVLKIASSQGYEEVVQMLLDKVVDANAPGHALQAASDMGHEKVVRMLLDEGADANAQGGSYCSSLYISSYWGRERMVRMLLDKGADVNAQGDHFGNALQAASYTGCVKIVQMLLDNGADINARGGKYGNALNAASFKNHDKVVQILLQHGADTSAEKAAKRSASQAGIGRGNEDVVAKKPKAADYESPSTHAGAEEESANSVKDDENEDSDSEASVVWVSTRPLPKG